MKLGLIGHPLGHSLSPRLHKAAMQALEIDGDYSLYPVPPLPEGAPVLEALLDRMRRGELHGLNVTIPHKQAVIPWLDRLSPVARAVNAVNTILVQDGELVGENTDVGGFRTDLKQVLNDSPGSAPSPVTHQGSAIILGAGGAARAVACALVQEGWQVYIAARRMEQARELAERMERIVISDRLSVISNMTLEQEAVTDASNRVIPILLNKSSISNQKSKVTLIVNTTPLGMSPETEASPWPREVPFPEGAIVYDLVYNPPVTELMRSARAAGLSATNGLGMLVEQAALAFERWTGKEAPRQAMHQSVSDYTSQEGI